ncbi:MAG: bifunctional phosphopantothenoylcysteine decarboxylase/phosphopantothenate--cysteine ligase CoaBC [Rhodocyclaceae bacterium]|jgi:phosphopantothenoylcysteine decarboxylase/phosphopantothenate--cysteine ligase|nr:bifunctional phosphopantothenoylcysteine decarboxylase/phosphopantothenate--cysteine ligase CoaBC [Rhodocyclaceae bacterium]
MSVSVQPSTELAGKRILLGVTGGIAAYKCAELVRLLKKAGADVVVGMTDAATRFVTPLTFQALSGHPVAVDAWNPDQGNGMHHIDLTRTTDLMVVAPASADFLAKMAQGRADDLLSTLVLARDCPLAVAPAMNRQMWSNPATQRNVTQLRGDGVAIWGPAVGEQACGETGEGRMLESCELLELIVAALTPKVLAGQRIVMTVGPTFEPLDPVRGITNRSSGQMGYAMARAFAQAGAEVTLVSGPVNFATPMGVRRMDVLTAAEMRQAVMAEIANATVFVGVAAVADYRPLEVSEHKLKKTDSEAAQQSRTLELTTNPDILAEVASLPAAPYCVGFAAESQNLDEYAEAKRLRKRLPLIIGNLVADGLGTTENRVTLYDDAGSHPLPILHKVDLAKRLVDELARRLDAAS